MTFTLAELSANPAEGALVEFGHCGPLQLIALVQEGQPEGEADIACENFGILGPGDHCPGLMTVEMSPFMKALRVISATRTMAAMVRLPSVEL